MNNKTDEKYLYYFNVKDDSGKNRKFGLMKPSRKMKEDGDLFYASKLSQFITAGILPKVVWEKIFKDSGGIISDVERKEYSDLFDEYAECKNYIDELSTKKESDRTKEEKEKLSSSESSVVKIRKRMQEMEMAQINAFENTAEAKARNRTIVWWAASLGVEENESGVHYLLGSGSMDDRLDIYDDVIQNDKFLRGCFSRLNYLVTVWYLGSASTFEDFEQLDLEYVKKMEENVAVDEVSEDVVTENVNLELVAPEVENASVEKTDS